MRRRMMMGGNEDPTKINGYVKDGLIFYVDGIQKSLRNNILTSLVGDKYLTLQDGTVGETQKSYILDGNKFVANTAKYFGIIPISIEMCFKYNSTSNQFLYSNGGSGGGQDIRWGRYGSFIILHVASTPRVTVDWDLSTTPQGTLSETFSGEAGYWYPSLYINGDAVLNTSRGYWSSLKEAVTTLGGYTGELYSFRVYNRQLSSDEVKSNADNDNLRFSLNL